MATGQSETLSTRMMIGLEAVTACYCVTLTSKEKAAGEGEAERLRIAQIYTISISDLHNNPVGKVLLSQLY